MYKSLLPKCCVKKVFYYPFKCTSPCCHSAVSIRFFTTPLNVQVPAATVLCQYCFYNSSTSTSPCCHSAVSLRVITTPIHVQVLTATVLCQYVFRLPLYMYKSLLSQCCVNKGYYYPSTCTRPYCHSAVSKTITTYFSSCQHTKRHLLNCVAP